jgi:hypothetical protein
MIIYKDIISNDEVFCDSYVSANNPLVLVDAVVYKYKGKQITRKIGDDFDIGANASEEDGAGEGTEQAVESGINICLDNRLVETQFGKKAYQEYIKGYMKTIMEKIKERDGCVDTFKKGCSTFVKSVLGEFKEYQFFIGESMNADGMVVLVKWEGEDPYLYFFKDGLDEEKV